jgi:hypothetical protein
MSIQPSLRIGDRDRDAVAAELQEHFARGRLTLEEFNQRLDAVFAAKTQADLSRITSDLPHIRPWGSLPGSRPGTSMQTSSWQQPSAPSGRAAMAAPFAGPEWTGPHARQDWHRGQRAGAPRGGFALLMVLMSMLASWYVVYDVILVGLRVPLAGRLGLLIAIYTVIKALLRRIFRRR